VKYSYTLDTLNGWGFGEWRELGGVLYVDHDTERRGPVLFEMVRLASALERNEVTGGTISVTDTGFSLSGVNDESWS
jgi:hypothetical protein